MTKELKYTTPDQIIATTRTLFYTVSYLLPTGFVERTDPIYSEQRLGQEIIRLANEGIIFSINSHHV